MSIFENSTKYLVSFIFGICLVLFIYKFGQIVNVENAQMPDNEKTIDRQSSPPDTEDNFVLGQYYFNQDEDPDNGDYDLDKAREYYSAVIRENPQGNNLVWYQLGRIDFIQGRFNAAIYKFNKQMEYFGELIPNVHYMLGLTYGYKARESGQTDDWEKGEEHFLKFLEFYPDSPWARTDLSWIYFAQGKYEDILPVIEKGLETNPDNPWLLNMLGLALLNTGNTTQAHEYFTRALAEAEQLTTHDWGKSYPGNDPASWPTGLAEMKKAIAHNVAITAPQE